MLENLIKKHHFNLDKINEILSKSLVYDNPCVEKLVTNCIRQRGKQLRPLIVLMLADNFVPYNEDKINEMASIYEKIHIASLIHDDVIDHCSQRRQQKTLNEEFDNEKAILLGDYVFASVFVSAAKFGEEFVEAVAQTISCLIKGELKQQQNIFFEQQSLESYLSVITDKSAALLELTFTQTLRQLGADAKVVSNAKIVAITFGQIFQIVDDWIDFCVLSQGKNAGVDADNGFVTLPWILLYQLSNAEEKARLVELWKSAESKTIANSFIKTLTQKYDLSKIMQKEVFQLYGQFQSSLAILSEKIDYVPLQQLTDYFVQKVVKEVGH